MTFRFGASGQEAPKPRLCAEGRDRTPNVPDAVPAPYSEDWLELARQAFCRRHHEETHGVCP